MGAISALSTTSRTLKRNSVLFAIALIITLVSLAPSGISALLSPPVAWILSLPLSFLLFFLSPFFLGGLLSMASEGIDGTTRFETFVAGGKDNYIRLFGAMVLLAILFGAIAAIVTTGIAVTAVFVLGMNSAGAGGAMVGGAGSLGIVTLLGLLGALVVLLPMFLFQFYAPAVVVSDLGIVDSLKRSAGLVRRNLVSTLGYSAIIGLVGLVAGVSGAVVSMPSGFNRVGMASMASANPGLGIGFVVAALVVSVLVSTVVAAFGSVYQVAFYGECLESLD
jgi:hypothetical protein